MMRWPTTTSSTTSAKATGNTIRPGALGQHRQFIDHGIEVVIEETSVSGDNVTIYQSASFVRVGPRAGATPSSGNGVHIGCGAKIIGPFTLGDEAKIGAGDVVSSDVDVTDANVVGIRDS